MKRLIFILLLIIIFGLFNTQVHAAVVLNELFPKTEDVARQWVELYNTGSEPVSLNLWTLSTTDGTPKTFLLGADWNIAPHGFITLFQSRTGITFNKEGDTVRLTDDKNTLVDSQSFISTLGYNTAMGRSPDGGISWTVCNIQTPNLPNDCPQATPTPTFTPTPTPAPLYVPPPPIVDTTAIYQPPATIPLQITTPSNTPTPTFPPDAFVIRVPSTITMSKTATVQISVVVIAWILLILIASIRKKHKKKRDVKKNEMDHS